LPPLSWQHEWQDFCLCDNHSKSSQLWHATLPTVEALPLLLFSARSVLVAPSYVVQPVVAPIAVAQMGVMVVAVEAVP
jgi:hypothetical protein